MRVVNGKQINEIDAPALAAWRGRYQHVVIDLGTGDGRVVQHLAARNPGIGVIGVDLCAANLRAASRAAGQNALFIVADALDLPAELRDIASRVTIHLPWGSLLRGLLTADTGLLQGLRSLGCARARYEITVNAGALAEAGWTFQSGSEQVIENLQNAGFHIDARGELSPAALRAMPSTWAKRLAFGRDPRAISISGRRAETAQPPAPTNPRPPTSVPVPVPVRATLPGWPAPCRSCYEDVSLSAPTGPVSAQPHHGARGASPQEGGLVARARTRAPQI